MRNVLLIIQREYLVRVRTKSFVFFTLVMPLLVGAVVVLPSQFLMRSSSTRHIVIVAEDRGLANSVKEQLIALSASGEGDPTLDEEGKRNRAEFEVTVETPPTDVLRQQLVSDVREGNLDGFAWIEGDAVATRKGVYYSRGTSDFMDASLVSRALRLALSGRQLADHGFSPEQAKTLLGPVRVDTVHIDRHGSNKSNGLGAFFLPFLLLLGIYMTVLIYGLYVMRSCWRKRPRGWWKCCSRASVRCN